ncbi:helix-turn-helix transcriptional regulator [Blastomonas aquatica]|uniref:helix-turn-helix transcriptional regulator n=1 Tax=Blastomonas aquatica TaxID=1510276 RepID=UPI00166F3794|nr:LuxR family transcriptional regulator [Blastomonas aquatica]
MNQWHLTQELSQEISCATDEVALFAALEKATALMDFDHFALTYDRRGLSEPGNLLVHNYPQSWATVYNGFDLGKADPVRRAGERALTGFSWRQLEHYIPLTTGDRQMLAVGRENGLADGYTVPRHLVGEASGTCTFVIGCERDMPDYVLHCAEIVGATALAAARRISGSKPVDPRPVLSERQRECVLWSARGKTAGEIAAILGISEETVVQHLKNARERYDVHGRQMLILCALFDGLIGFSDIFDWWTPA